jgi:uncharacterized membrane protein
MMEAIFSTSSISLIISAPRSAVVKPTLVRDRSATISNCRKSVAEAAPVSVSVSESALHPAFLLFLLLGAVDSAGPEPPAVVLP